MKNNIIKLLSLVAVFGMLMTSCSEEEELIFDGSSIADNILVTAGTSSIFNLTDVPNAAVDFTITEEGGTGSVSQVAIYKQYIPVDGSDASDVILHATINSLPSTLDVTLADALNGFGIVPDSFAIGDQVVLTFRPTVNGTEYIASQASLVGTGSCPSDLGGMYEVTTTYGYHDFLPNFDTFTDTVELVDDGDGFYSVDDLSGGLYGQGPYVGAYGTSGIAAQIQDVCGEILLNNISDPWGACIQNPNEATSAVDQVTGVITIAWFCEGYTENGISVYTPM